MANIRQPFLAETNGAFTPQELSQILEALSDIYWTESDLDLIYNTNRTDFIPEPNETVFGFLTTVYKNAYENTEDKKRKAKVRIILERLEQLSQYSHHFGMILPILAISDALGLNYDCEYRRIPPEKMIGWGNPPRTTLLKECQEFSLDVQDKLLEGLANAIKIFVIRNVNPTIVVDAVMNNVNWWPDDIKEELMHLYKISADASIVMQEIPTLEGHFIHKHQIFDTIKDGLFVAYEKFYKQLYTDLTTADEEEIKKRYQDIIEDGYDDAAGILESLGKYYIMSCPELKLHELTTMESVDILRRVNYNAKDLEARMQEEFNLYFKPFVIGPNNTFANHVSPALIVIQKQILRNDLLYKDGKALDQIIAELAKAPDTRHPEKS